MAQGFYLKTLVGSTWNKITNFYVKTGISGWAQVTDAWVKTGLATWTRFYSALMAPTNPVQLLASYAGTNNETLRLQGKNYTWVPTPQTLKYYFRWVPEGGSTSYIGPSGSSGDTTSNPATSTILPGSTSYITIDPAGSNFSTGTTNRYYFEVRATGASGTIYSSQSLEDVTIVSPKAPILSFTVLSNTSVRITITASSNADWYATNRYILYTYDSTNGFLYSGGGRGGLGASLFTFTQDLTGLTFGRNYTVYVLPITGTSGTTTSNFSGYPGVTASLADVKTGNADPQPFTTLSFTKNYPSSSAQGIVRSTTLSWNASTNATRYEILYEGRNASTDPWTTVQTFAASPYETNTSQIRSWGSPVPSGGFAYYYFMRAKIRASSPDSTVTVISDNDVYIEASGTAPGALTFGTISYPTRTSTSIPFTVGTAGSNYLDSNIEYMYRTDSGTYGSTWTTNTYNTTTLTGTISLTTVAGTKYWIKMRIRNYDDLYSTVTETSFTPPAAPTLQTGIKRSINTGVTFTNTSQIMYISTNGYIAYANNTPASISIPTTGKVLNIFGPNDLSQSTTGGTTIQATYKNTSSYFVVSWNGRYLGSSTETLSYEARFYWNSDLVEVNCITNNLTVAHSQSDNAVYSDGAATKTWASNSTSIGSWTSDTGMTTAPAPTATDDGYTAITATKPVIKGSGTKKIIPLGITINNGSNVAYVSTNGFIGLDSDPGSSIGIPGSGRYLNILQADLKQSALFTSGTSTTYSIRYQGALLSDATQTVDYEIKFTFGSTSAEVYIIANNLTSTASDNVLIVNGVAQNTWSGASASTMGLSASTSNTTNNNVDDARTVITLQGPPATPTGVNTSSSGSVTWTAVAGATKYYIDYTLSTNSTGTSTYGPLSGVVDAPATSYQISYVTIGTTYYNYAKARVAAYNAGGTSSYSAYSPSTGYV